MFYLRVGLVFFILDEKKISFLNCGIIENNMIFFCIFIIFNIVGLL